MRVVILTAFLLVVAGLFIVSVGFIVIGWIQRRARARESVDVDTLIKPPVRRFEKLPPGEVDSVLREAARRRKLADVRRSEAARLDLGHKDGA